MRRQLSLLAALTLGIAAPAAAQAPSAALLTPEVGDAAVWRAAGRRLQVELNGLPAASLAAALSSDIAGWRTSPPTARAEAATALEFARLWFAAIQASFAGARWPANRPAETYARAAPRVLLEAWRELEEAAATGESPQFPLGRAWQVQGWTLGITDRPSPFDTLESEAIEAIVGATAPRPEAGGGAAAALTAETAGAGLLFGQAGGDRVGPRGAGPDGAPDVALSLFAVHRGRAVARIELLPIDAAGRPCCGRRWSTADQSAEFLGVLSGPTGNAQGFAPALPGLGEQIILIVNDGLALQAGARLAAVIHYADGSRDHAILEVPAWARR